jgi:imidazolonepropionase-like amidohydrolase
MSTPSLHHEVDSGLTAELGNRLASATQQRVVWLRVGQLVDGTSQQPRRNANVVFDADGIYFVGDADDLPAPALLAPGQNSPDAELPNVTLLPMLVESHAHMFLDGAPVDSNDREQYLRQLPEWMLARARARWGKILACGVGAVRDAGDKHGVGLALAQESKLQRGKRRSTPYLDSPGAAIFHRGRYGSFMGEPLEDHPSPSDCVAARVAAGVDRIKLLASGIINFQAGRVTTPAQMSAEEVRQLVAASKHHGRQTFAHASGVEGIGNAIAGGVTTVEHGFFVTREQLACMRDLQIGWVPTFAPVALQLDRAAEFGHDATVRSHLERIVAEHGKMLGHAAEIGVPILAGSDAGSCGVPHGLGLIDELVHMERAGLAPHAVLQSATGTCATLLDFPEPIGEIAAGTRARMILTEHDPLATVANLRREKLVLCDGRAIVSPPELDPEGL